MSKKNKKDFKLPPHTYELVVTTLSQKQGWGISQTKIPNTWTVTQGGGETALVIDTGHPNHNDIGINAIEGKNFTNSNTINDIKGHQTHVTGIICAQNNNQGMVGVAPKSKCITAKALGDNGSGSFKWIVKALDYAIEKKVSVVSMSLGASIGTPGFHAVIKKLYKANIPIICAAGNDSTRGVDYPAKYPETIAVAAYDKNGKIAGFSGIGKEVDWAAPGVSIYSTYLDNKYAILNGTSMATPFITGVILLLLAKHKKQEKETGKNDCKTIEQIKEHLIKYTVDKGYVGKDEYFGYGIIDVEKLILESNENIEEPEKEPENPPESVPSEPLKKSWWQIFTKWLNNIFK